MTTFLLYTLLLVCLGIFVRTFWVPLSVIGAIIVIILGIIASAWVTALVFTVISTVFTQGELVGFSTYFMYSLVFFIVATIVYGAIVADIFEYGIDFIKTLFKK